MTTVTIEVPDTLTSELAQYGISDEQIEVLMVQVMQMWLRMGRSHLSRELVQRWLEALEESEDVRDVQETERMLVETPGAFMSLEEFNAAFDEEESGL